MAFGDFVGRLGNVLGLPEMGISEKLGGTPGPTYYESQSIPGTKSTLQSEIPWENPNPTPSDPIMQYRKLPIEQQIAAGLPVATQNGPTPTIPVGSGSGSGSGSGATTPAKVIPDRSGSINLAKAGLAGADEQLNTGLSSIASSLEKILGGYGADLTKNEGRFNEESTTNKNNFIRNKWAAMLNAAEGRRGLFGTLASLGALSGTGVDLANRAVQRGANMDISGASDNFKENQTGLTRVIEDFRSENEKREEEARQAAEANKIDLRNLVDTNRQKLYTQLGDDYNMMENKTEAQKYWDMAAQLYPSIGRTSAMTPNLAARDVPFTLPSLANYLGGAASTQVKATPSQGQTSLPGLIATNPLLREREREF